MQFQSDFLQTHFLNNQSKHSLLSDSELGLLLGEDTPPPSSQSPVSPSDAPWPQLDTLHRRTALLLSKRLKARFRPDIQVREHTISQPSPQQFQQAGITALLQLQPLQQKPLPLAFSLDKPAAHQAVDLLLGGAGQSPRQDHFSSVERQILARLADALIAALHLACQPLVRSQARLTHWLPQQNPLQHFAQEPLISAVIQLGIPSIQIPIQLYWPASTLHYLWPQQKTDNKQLQRHLAQNRVRVSAELGSTSMPLQQFLKLHPGSTIPLDQSLNQPLQVSIEGIPFLKAFREPTEGFEAIRFC